jgi:hypothetical protein
VGSGEGISTKLWLEDLGFESILAQKLPDRLWGKPRFLLIGTGLLAIGIKRLVREAEQSPPSSAKVKNECSYTHSPHMSSGHGQDQLTVIMPCNGIITVRAEGCAGYIRVSEGIQTVQLLLLTRQSYRTAEILNPFIKSEQGKFLIINAGT